MSESRKIAAILVSDIVGFSRLAGADEDRLLARLRALRSDLIDPIIAVHRGRVVKRTGDGALVEFRSVVDAVRCAIEVQNGMVERNIGLPPERRIEFRIGIHLGDVVEEADGDLMGDGVNIAARLEGVAQPGSICLSEDAYRQVSARLDITVADLGMTQLKNIERPIRVYSLQVGTPAQPKAAAKAPERAQAPRWLWPAAVVALILLAAGAWRWKGDERPALTGAATVAVLPFDNLGGDAEASRLADGMTEDVITDLGRFKEILVIARNSVMPYKGKTVDARQVAKDLNVNFVLTGSVQHRDDRLRVTAQLTDARTSTEIWSQRWDRPAANMFAVQAEVADEVARTMGIGNGNSDIGPIRTRLLEEAKKRPLANLSAYEFLLLAREQLFISTKASRERGLEYINKAIAMDPNLAYAYAVRGWLKSLVAPWYEVGVEVERDMRMALTLDPHQYSAHAGLIMSVSMTGRWDELAVAIENALREHPANPTVLRVCPESSCGIA